MNIAATRRHSTTDAMNHDTQTQDAQLKIARGVDAIAALGDILEELGSTRTVSDETYRTIARAVARGQAMLLAMNQVMQEMRRDVTAGKWLDEIGGTIHEP